MESQYSVKSLRAGGHHGCRRSPCGRRCLSRHSARRTRLAAVGSVAKFNANQCRRCLFDQSQRFARQRLDRLRRVRCRTGCSLRGIGHAVRNRTFESQFPPEFFAALRRLPQRRHGANSAAKNRTEHESPSMTIPWHHIAPFRPESQLKAPTPRKRGLRRTFHTFITIPGSNNSDPRPTSAISNTM